MTTVGIIISVLLLICLIIAAIVLVIIKKKRESNKVKEKETTDINHVYGTYEVHDDPVAEVKTLFVQDLNPI